MPNHIAKFLLAKSALASLLLAAACGQVDAPEPPGPSGGKADNVGASAAQCSFAQAPLFDHLFSGAVDSDDLGSAVVGGAFIDRLDKDRISKLEHDQIVLAVHHLGLVDLSEGFDEAIGASDDGEFELLELELADLSGSTDFFFAGDWVRFFSGDTEVGVIFEADTLTIVAEVSDGDIKGCTQAAPEPVDCTEALLNGFSADSALHRVHIDEFVDGVDEINAQVAAGAIALVGARLGCEETDAAIAIDSDIRCATLEEHAPWTSTCYVESSAGYFMVTMDFVEHVNVLFSRWD